MFVFRHHTFSKRRDVLKSALYICDKCLVRACTQIIWSVSHARVVISKLYSVH